MGKGSESEGERAAVGDGVPVLSYKMTNAAQNRTNLIPHTYFHILKFRKFYTLEKICVNKTEKEKKRNTENEREQCR